MASKLSPVGAGGRPVDDAHQVLRRPDGLRGSCWTSPGIFAVRVFGAKGLMHYEIDFWNVGHAASAAQGVNPVYSTRQGRLGEA